MNLYVPNGLSLKLFDILENFFTRGICKFASFYDAVVCDKFLFSYFVYTLPWAIRERSRFVCFRYRGGDFVVSVIFFIISLLGIIKYLDQKNEKQLLI